MCSYQNPQPENSRSRLATEDRRRWSCGRRDAGECDPNSAARNPYEDNHGTCLLVLDRYCVSIHSCKRVNIRFSRLGFSNASGTHPPGRERGRRIIARCHPSSGAVIEPTQGAKIPVDSIARRVFFQVAGANPPAVIFSIPIRTIVAEPKQSCFVIRWPWDRLRESLQVFNQSE